VQNCVVDWYYMLSFFKFWFGPVTYEPFIFDVESMDVTFVFRSSHVGDKTVHFEGYLEYEPEYGYITGKCGSTMLKEFVNQKWLKLDDVYWNRNEIANYSIEHFDKKIPWVKESCRNYDPTCL
jgi:hypothetical protein